MPSESSEREKESSSQRKLFDLPPEQGKNCEASGEREEDPSAPVGEVAAGARAASDKLVWREQASGVEAGNAAGARALHLEIC